MNLPGNKPVSDSDSEYLRLTALTDRKLPIIMFIMLKSIIVLFFLFPIFPPLPTPLGAGGWSPLDTDRYQWLQVDLGSRKQVVSVATQGRYSSSDWTSKYRLLYSDTQKNWRPYLQDGNIWVRIICHLI